MLTPRGLWFLISSGLVLVVGAFVIPYYSVVPAIVGVTLWVWLLCEWTMFHLRSNAAVSRLRVTRTVTQGGREVPMVWAGVPFEVRVAVENPSALDVPFAVIEDRTAVATERTAGAAKRFVAIPPGGSVVLEYTLKAPSPGVLRFEGVKVRVADLNGFFYRRVFLREGAEFLVLPPLVNDEGRQKAVKRFNTLPPPGIHRLRKAGSGDELLDLRDYRAGDPPKMIAWKASARRDRLITKEFENDVPVRAVLFLDTSEGVRLGPPGNTLLTRMAGVAAAVSQASAANRDLVGLTTFDEAAFEGGPPARTKIHMIGILRRLAEASALQPGVAGVPPEQLTRRAYPLAQEVYPDLMAKRVNGMPLGRLWLPLLDRKWGFVALLVILINLALVYYSRDWRLDSFDSAGYRTRKIGGAWSFFPKLVLFGALSLWSLFWPAALALVFWFVHGVRGWFGERKSELTRRKQLGALFSLQDGTGPDGVERFVFDDDAYAARVAAFLQHHLLRCPVPLYDDHGRYRFRCTGKAQVLAEAMVRAVGRARDNELYVILADLAELGADLAPVVRACRVARSRHHHILVIVPWPADVPSPDAPDAATPAGAPEDDSLGGKLRGPRADKLARKESAQARGLVKYVRDRLTRQYHESFRSLRRELGRAGATVMRVNDGDPVQLVLDRLDRLRGLRSRR